VQQHIHHEHDQQREPRCNDRIREFEKVYTARHDHVGEPQAERDASPDDPAAGLVAQGLGDVMQTVSEHHENQPGPTQHVDQVEDQHDLSTALTEGRLARIHLLEPVALTCDRERHRRHE
jgi:hypothetical protein